MIRIYLILLLTVTSTAWAEQYSMRRCVLLPVTDTVSNAIGFKVYERVESYLKASNWCEYISSADMLNVFSKYRDKLKDHLKDPNVLKTVVTNLRSGTLIRINLENEAGKVILKLDVIGENGIDVYLSEKMILDKADINWLEVYEAAIPYDGKVNGVLGDQVTFYIGKNESLVIGQEFVVRRLKQKKQHPLLQKVVAWESEKIAEGTIHNISSKQGLGVVKLYYGKKGLKKGDWIKLKKNLNKKFIDEKKYPEMKSYQFGKLGTFALSLDLSNSSVGTNTSGNNKKLGGFIYGLTAEAEAWITRNYFVTGEFARRLGTLKKTTGNPDLDNASITSGSLKIGGGYKYLPMGFFFGPQVNLYGGYVRYTYNIETSVGDGLGESALSGIMLGVGGSIPLDKGLRIFAKGELVPFASFTDESGIYGTSKSNSSMVLEFGGKYQYSPTLRLIGSMEMINNSTKFKSGNTSELNLKDTIFKFGGSVTF
jgi:hypothetical protein